MERMWRLDRPMVVTIAFAVLITAMAGALGRIATNSGCIDLVVASSQEKSLLMQNAAAAFIKTTRPVVEGRCVSVTVEAVISGAAEQALVNDWKGQSGPVPDVWAPSATTWLKLLDQHRIDLKMPPLLEPDTPSLMQSPLVIAMPEPMARALGWPTGSIGWKDIFDLARDPRGWAARGHKDWGAFRLGKTNPHLSTSGLNSLISTYFAASGKTSNLTAYDLTRKEVTTFVTDVESSVAHYGDTATTFLSNLLTAQQIRSAPYVSAVAVEEKEVWNYNVGNVTGDPSLQAKAVPPSPLLAAIYPADGTILADHPYAVLRWAKSDNVAAAALFLAYLLSPASQEIFKENGFRDSQGKSGPEISPTNDLDPDQPGSLLVLPKGEVIAAIQRSWDRLRKPARVLIVVDASASVGAAPLAAIKRPLADAILGELASTDQVGLLVAPGATGPFDELVPVGPLTTTQSEQIRARIQEITLALGQANLVDVVGRSVDYLRSRYDPKSIDAIVLLSPGTGATSTGVEKLQHDLSTQPADQPIHVFTVAYGYQPDLTTLSRIARASGAGPYSTVSPGSLHDLMIQVLSNF